MKASHYDDPLFGPTFVCEDGRAMHAMYLVEVRSPSESKAPYDYFNDLATIPPEAAFRPLAEEKGVCALVQNVTQSEHAKQRVTRSRRPARAPARPGEQQSRSS